MQNITEFTLQPADGNFSFNPGQFLFINFPKSVALREAHPFTISSAPQDAQLRLSVKADGDFTERLAQELSEGTLAKVDGPYGMFDYTRYGSRQIWIAGGIGITPFLSWLKSMGPAASQEIEIFYCARNEEDAIYAEEIRTLCEALPKVACHLHLSEGSGRITAKKIEEQIGDVKGRDISLCAPGAMRTALVKQFQGLGVSSDSIHFEAFNLR